MSVSTFVADNAAGSVIIALVVIEHPLSSVTVKVYVPGSNNDKSSVVLTDISSHKYAYGVVPPVIVASIEPSSSPLHVELTDVFEALNAAGSEIAAVVEIKQLFASVTVKVYKPDSNDDKSSVVLAEASSHK